MPRNVPGQHLGKRGGLVRRIGLERQRGCAFRRRDMRLAWACGDQGTHQVARCLGCRHDAFGQRHAEPALDPQHQLDATEAVETVIFFKPPVERGTGRRAGRMQLGRYGADRFEQRRSVDCPMRRLVMLRCDFLHERSAKGSQAMLAQAAAALLPAVAGSSGLKLSSVAENKALSVLEAAQLQPAFEDTRMTGADILQDETLQIEGLRRQHAFALLRSDELSWPGGPV